VSKWLSAEAKAFFINAYMFPAALYDTPSRLLTQKSINTIDCAACKVLLQELQIKSWYNKNVMYGLDGVGLSLTEATTVQWWASITTLTTIFNGPGLLARTTTINNLTLYEKRYLGFPFHSKPVACMNTFPTIVAFVAANSHCGIKTIFPGVWRKDHPPQLQAPDWARLNIHDQYPHLLMDIFMDSLLKNLKAGSGIVFAGQLTPVSVTLRTPREQSNNNMELYSIKFVLKQVQPCAVEIHIFTDSVYTISTVNSIRNSHTPPHHLTPNRETIANIAQHLTTHNKVSLHHIYSHVSEKLKKDHDKWTPKIDTQKCAIPIHFPTVCTLNEMVDCAADEGMAMAPHGLDSLESYTLTRVVVVDREASSPIPRPLLRKKWRSRWNRPTLGVPRCTALAHHPNTGLYRFFLCASNNLLPLCAQLHSPNLPCPDTPNCPWCEINNLGRKPENLDHVLASCPAHAALRQVAREKIDTLANLMDTVSTTPTATTSNWLGIIRPPKGKTAVHYKAFNDIKATLLSTSHRMWMDRCAYHHSMGLTYNSRRKTATPTGKTWWSVS
jgi:ribonuclease HI